MSSHPGHLDRRIRSCFLSRLGACFVYLSGQYSNALIIYLVSLYFLNLNSNKRGSRKLICDVLDYDNKNNNNAIIITSWVWLAVCIYNV